MLCFLKALKSLMIISPLLLVGVGCSSDSSSTTSILNKNCSRIEPENPYFSGSGHYAGYKWGQNGNLCTGNSSSFIEGCEEFERQDEEYTTCLDR